MLYQLSKSEKKIARACIDKGLDLEFMEGLERSEAVILIGEPASFPPAKRPIKNYFRRCIRKTKRSADVTTA